MDAGAATASAPEVTDITAADQGGFAAAGAAGSPGGGTASQQASPPPPLKAAPALYYVTEPEAEPMDADNEEGGPDIIDVQELPSGGGPAQQPDAPTARAADGAAAAAKRPPRSPRADGSGGGADAGAGARDEQLLRQRRPVLRAPRSRSASVDSACEGGVTDEPPLASPRLRVPRAASPAAPGDGEGTPTTPQKRQLSAAPDAEEGGAPSPQNAGHAAKRPAPGDADDSATTSSGGGGGDGTASRSPSRPPLASVFAQPHVQAVIPPGEMHLPGGPEEMLPPPPRENGSQGAASQQQQQGSPSPSPPPPPGVRQPPTAAQQLLQQQLQQQGNQRVWSSGSLPPAFTDGVPSAASLQGWLSIGTNGSPLAGSPLKRGGHGGDGSGSGSFRKWIKSENSCGSFTLPFGSSSSVPASLELEDSLAMDIQLLAPVVPEEVPPEEEGEEAVAAAEARQWERQQAWKVEQERQRQMGMHAAAVAASIAASERAFHAKIAMWEDELLGMLQTQMAPVTIRAVVQAFKDRIVTERDKAEFKALCDKYTVVVEYPVNSGIKCLALKAWLQEPEVEEQPAGSPAPATAAAAAAPAGATT